MEPLTKQIGEIDQQFKRMLREQSEDVTISRQLHALVNYTKQQLHEARVRVQYYELSDTRAEQIQHGEFIRATLEKVEATVLNLSQHGMFTPADVAHISSKLEMTRSRIS